MSPQLLSGAARLAGSSLLRLQSDDRLVALVRDGHDPAYSAVVDRYHGELLRYATRIVGESRAEDVIQQALVNAHHAMTSSDSDIRLRPWLYRIVHNTALNALRAGQRVEELDDRLAAAGGVEDSVEHRERLREALAAIARLPEPQRDALTLQALHGRSHEEIADALGVSPGAARQQVHRARGTVRAAVSAITPYGLVARFAMAGAGEPASAIVTGAGAAGAGAAGLTATLGKIGAGVLAAGAIATGTTGNVPFVGGPAKQRGTAERSARSGAVGTAGEGDAALAAAFEPGDDNGGARSGRSSDDRGEADRSRRGRRRGSGASGGDDRGRRGSTTKRHGSGDDRQGGGSGGNDSSGSSGSGSGGGDRRGSGGERSGSGSGGHGSDDGPGSGSGSGGHGSDDGPGSGSGSSGSGSDDIAATPVLSDGSRGGSDGGVSLESGSSGSGSSSYGDDGGSHSGSGSSGGSDGSGSGSSGGGSGSGSSGSGSGSGSGGSGGSGGGSDDGLPGG